MQVVINMKFSSKASAENLNVGVEAAFDGIAGSGGAGATFNKDDSSLAANSKISLSANGGDPQIAAVISDFSPATHLTSSFRGDLQAWLKSVPMFPRLVERVPELTLVSEILPWSSTNLPPGKTDAEDRLEWKMRQRSLEQAIEVMSGSRQAAHAQRQQCEKEYDFKDYNRLVNNECLSFGVHAPGGFQVSFSQEPMRNDNALRLEVGVDETNLLFWDATKVRPPAPTGATATGAAPVLSELGLWVKKWSSTSQAATARGSVKLMGKYWMCMQENNTVSTFLFGKNDDLVLRKDIVLPAAGAVFNPRYFALSCDGYEGYFSNIEVDPIDVYQSYLRVEARGASGEASGHLCSIDNCKNTSEADGGTTCACTCHSSCMNRR